MSYDLNLYIKSIDDSIIPKWKESLKEFGIIADIHPDFSFKDHGGFLPFKIKIDNPNFAPQYELISGFELSINDVSQEELLDYIDEGIELPQNIQNDCKDLFFAVRYLFRSFETRDYYPDPLEFRIAWASASILCNLLDGVLSNPQVGGGTYLAKDAKSIAKSEIQNLTDKLKKEEWEFHKFEGWT